MKSSLEKCSFYCGNTISQPVSLFIKQLTYVESIAQLWNMYSFLLLLLFTRKSKPSVSTAFEWSCQTERQCSHQERNILEVNFLLKPYVVNRPWGDWMFNSINTEHSTLLSLNAYFTSQQKQKQKLLLSIFQLIIHHWQVLWLCSRTKVWGGVR